MTHVQIYVDRETNKPAWGVIHNPPHPDSLDTAELRTDIVDQIDSFLSRAGGEGVALLVASGDNTVAVLR